MLGTMRLSIRMLRRHMALYSGCMATVVSDRFGSGLSGCGVFRC